MYILTVFARAACRADADASSFANASPESCLLSDLESAVVAANDVKLDESGASGAAGALSALLLAVSEVAIVCSAGNAHNGAVS